MKTKSERGNALVLSVLILLALTSVGVLSIQRTTTDLNVSGNLTRATQAFVAGEAGLGHGLSQVGGNPDHFVSLIEMQKRGGNAGFDVPASDGKTLLVWDRIADGGYSTVLGTNDPLRIPHVAYDSAARIRQDVAYRVEITHVNEIHDPAGYGVDQDICLHLFDFTAEGALPTELGQLVRITMGQTDTVVLRNRARAAAGPGKCQN